MIIAGEEWGCVARHAARDCCGLCRQGGFEHQRLRFAQAIFEAFAQYGFRAGVAFAAACTDVKLFAQLGH